MVTRSSFLVSTVATAAALMLAGCASNGQPAQQSQAEEEANASQPKPVVVSAELTTPVSKPAPAPSATKTTLPAVASKSPDDEPAVVLNMTEVDIYLRGPDFRYARWHVESDGTLRFAGDRFARSSEWGWTGQVTFAQSQSINAIASRWVSARPKGDDSNGEVWEVSVQGADGRTRFTVHGTASSVAEMWSIFNTAGKGHRHAQADPVPPRDLDSLFFNRPVQVEAGDE